MLNWKVDYLSKIVEFDLTGVLPTIFFLEMHFRWGLFTVDCLLVLQILDVDALCDIAEKAKTVGLSLPFAY